MEIDIGWVAAILTFTFGLIGFILVVWAISYFEVFWKWLWGDHDA